MALAAATASARDPATVRAVPGPASRLAGSGGDAGVVLTQVSDLPGGTDGPGTPGVWLPWACLAGVRARHNQAIISRLS
jgi:hypothetical protein